MAALSEFVTRLWDHAWWFLTNVVLVRKPLFDLLPEGWKKKIREHWISARVSAWELRPWAIYIFAASGLVVASFLAFQDEYNALRREHAVRETIESPYHWQLLLPEEMAALRSELRDIAPQRIFILCGGDDCGDLARSLRDVFNGLHWKVNCCNWSFSGFAPGIQLWGGSDQLKGIAGKIERATKGRLKVDLSPSSVIDTNQTEVVISIGPKP
jgi:hypothetical protein